MRDYQIYRKIRPFILKRVGYAALGFFVMLLILFLISLLGERYPEYRKEIILLWSGIGIFLGWKIIRHGEARYRMAQIAVISELVRPGTGKQSPGIHRKKAMERVRQTFRYVGFFSLLKNILREKSLHNVPQFLSVAVANLIPYMGICSFAWIFTHENESLKLGACHAVSAWHRNRKRLTPLILAAFLKELVLVTLLFFFLLFLEAAVCQAVMQSFPGLDRLLDRFRDFSEALEIVWDFYFETVYGYHWILRDVLIVTALYLAWFIKVFSLRAYQSIGIIRAYLKAGEENPPTDTLYLKLVGKQRDSSPDSAPEPCTDLNSGLTPEPCTDLNSDLHGQKEELP